MARSQKPDSADSQFFIVLAPSAWLDGKYSLWGQVVEGMEFVGNIKMGAGQSGRVKNPDVIVRMQVAADAE
jgi:peptidylprolyl isomerase